MFFDAAIRRLLRNASVLLGSDVVAAGVRVVTLAITARTLGVSEFGVLVLIQTYVAVVDRVLNFQSWQALIKFGAEHWSNGGKSHLENLFKFGFFVDASTAIVGTLVCLALVAPVGELLGWTEETRKLAMMFSVVIVFNLEGTATAILRLADRFKLLGLQKILAAIFKLALTLPAFFIASDLAIFVAIAAISQIFGYLILLFFAVRVLRNEALNPLRAGVASKATAENQRLWTFLVTTNIHSTFRLLPDQLDAVLVGVLLGNSATGLYKVAKEVARILTRVVQPLYQAVFPELARMSARAEIQALYRLVVRSSSLVGAAALVFWVLLAVSGHLILSTIFGPDFVDAYAVMMWYAFGAAMSAAAFPITPAILAIGHPRIPLFVIIVSTLIYFGSFPFLVQRFGLEGAGMANIVLYATWIGIMGLVLLIVRNRYSPGQTNDSG